MKAACRLFATGIAASALTASSIATAQSQCPVVRAALSEQKSPLEGVAVTINSEGLVDVTRHGVAGAIRDAKTCQMDAPDYGFNLNCYWYFESGEARKAERLFDRLRRALDDCLPRVLEKQEPVEWTEEKLEEFRNDYGDGFVERMQNRESLGNYGQSFELQSGDEADVSLYMIRTKDSGRVSINFNVDRY